MKAHRIGAVFYILWGVFHVIIGSLLLYRLHTAGSVSALATIGSALPADRIPHVDFGVIDGVLNQYSWNVLWPGLFAIVVGALFNWKNSRVGYWVNLSVVSLVDSGFIVAIFLPGYISNRDGLTGPVLWALALVFTTVGIMRKDVAS